MKPYKPMKKYQYGDRIVSKPSLYKLGTAFLFYVVIVVASFLWSFTTQSAFWQNFALSLCTNLIGAAVIVVVIEYLLKQRYEEYSRQKREWEEVAKRHEHWLMFLEAKRLEVEMKIEARQKDQVQEGSAALEK